MVTDRVARLRQVAGDLIIAAQNESNAPGRPADLAPILNAISQLRAIAREEIRENYWVGLGG